jgi:hypothetical protein
MNGMDGWMRATERQISGEPMMGLKFYVVYSLLPAETRKRKGFILERNKNIIIWSAKQGRGSITKLTVNITNISYFFIWTNRNGHA